MIYLDSNIFLIPLLSDQADDPRFSPCRSLLSRVLSGQVSACTSVLTWDEIVWTVKRLADPRQAADAGDSFLAMPGIDLIACERNIVAKAQELVRKAGLKPRDAVHLSSATARRASSIVSYDPDFDAAPILKRILPDEV